MSVVKFQKEKQKKIKGLSKAIYIIAKIGKILVTIAIPFIVLAMLVVIYLIENIDISDNIISFKNFNEKIEFIEQDDKMTLKIGENEIDIKSELEKDVDKEFSKKIISEFVKEINKTSKTQKILFVILVSSMAIAEIVLTRIILKHLENLFKNIMDGETPFTLENVNHFKKMAYFMIATTVTPIVLSSLIYLITSLDIEKNLEIHNVIEILLLFAMAYVFEYGYEIQKDSNGKIYGEE